jgi:predicted RNA-binding protein with PIN domain
MTDIEKMSGTCEISETNGETALLTGRAPVITMKNYQKEVVVYTKGLGRLFYSLKGYEPCHNKEEVIESIGYDSERDIGNPTGSVFCAHGAGFLVDWKEVKKYMHVESCFQKKAYFPADDVQNQTVYTEERWISLEEIDQIINNTYYANQGRKSIWKRSKSVHDSFYEPASYVNRQKETREKYLIVDGYNIIHAWPELKELVDENMDGARMKLLDTLCNYQGIRKCQVIVVFDAYRVQGHPEEVIDYHNIHMVYTKEAQTADQYIEKFAHDNQKKYDITVATSDGLQQIIIRGAGCSLLSARELKAETVEANERIKQEYQKHQGSGREYLINALTPEVLKQLEEQFKEEQFKEEQIKEEQLKEKQLKEEKDK